MACVRACLYKHDQPRDEIEECVAAAMLDPENKIRPLDHIRACDMRDEACMFV